MRYLVTGGAGFIGSNIAEELVREGEDVRVLDNLYTGKKENLASFIDKIDFLEGDVRDKEAVEKALEGVDQVIHQAAFRSVAKSIEDPLLTNDINVNGTLNLLACAQRAGVKKFVNASTSAIYGDCDKYPQDESINPNPVSPYATSKLAAEYYCHLYDNVFGLETVSLRYFNVFGPRQNPESKYSSVIPAFIAQFMKDEPCVIDGDGMQSRDFVFIADIVKANIAASRTPAAKGMVINVGCGKDSSIKDIVENLKTVMEKEIEPVYGPRRPGDVDKTVADISRLKEILNVVPGNDLKDGLRKTVEWFVNK